jgi:hypothetical protein
MNKMTINFSLGWRKQICFFQFCGMVKGAQIWLAKYTLLTNFYFKISVVGNLDAIVQMQHYVMDLNSIKN